MYHVGTIQVAGDERPSLVSSLVKHGGKDNNFSELEGSWVAGVMMYVDDIGFLFFKGDQIIEEPDIVSSFLLPEVRRAVVLGTEVGIIGSDAKSSGVDVPVGGVEM